LALCLIFVVQFCQPFSLSSCSNNGSRKWSRRLCFCDDR
jgi:hypothetical protein